MMQANSSAPLLLYTVGYEGRSAKELLSRLKDAGVNTLLDVRYRPQSRKPGLSKTALARICAEYGIRYLHDRQLGTPPHLMERVRATSGYDDAVHEEYRGYLAGKVEALKAAAEQSVTAPTCLLCYEADPNDCHRKIVAEELAARTGLTVQHL